MTVAEILKNADLPENPADIIGRKFWAEAKWDKLIAGGGTIQYEASFGAIITGISTSNSAEDSGYMVTLTITPTCATLQPVKPEDMTLEHDREEVQILSLSFNGEGWQPYYIDFADGEQFWEFDSEIAFTLRVFN
jgi:hypothetical protein